MSPPVMPSSELLDLLEEYEYDSSFPSNQDYSLPTRTPGFILLRHAHVPRSVRRDLSSLASALREMVSSTAGPRLSTTAATQVSAEDPFFDAHLRPEIFERSILVEDPENPKFPPLASIAKQWYRTHLKQLAPTGAKVAASASTLAETVWDLSGLQGRERGSTASFEPLLTPNGDKSSSPFTPPTPSTPSMPSLKMSTSSSAASSPLPTPSPQGSYILFAAHEENHKAGGSTLEEETPLEWDGFQFDPDCPELDSNTWPLFFNKLKLDVNGPQINVDCPIFNAKWPKLDDIAHEPEFRPYDWEDYDLPEAFLNAEGPKLDDIIHEHEFKRYDWEDYDLPEDLEAHRQAETRSRGVEEEGEVGDDRSDYTLSVFTERFLEPNWVDETTAPKPLPSLPPFAPRSRLDRVKSKVARVIHAKARQNFLK